MPLKLFPIGVCLQGLPELQHSYTAASFLKFSRKLCCCVASGHFCYLFLFLLFRKKKINHETQIIHLLATTRGCSCILLSLEPTTSNKWVTAAAARLPTEMTNKSNHRKKKSPREQQKARKVVLKHTECINKQHLFVR